MNTKPLPPRSELLRLFEYSPSTGLLIWRWREDAPLHCNSRLAGKRAGRISGRKHQVKMPNGLYPVHRVIFKIVYNSEPDQVDHIDGDHFNNKLANLRGATASQNSCNQRKPKNNSSGFKGVHFSQNRFVARIAVAGRRIFLGSFSSPEEAGAAYKAAAVELHGQFARVAA